MTRLLTMVAAGVLLPLIAACSRSDATNQPQGAPPAPSVSVSKVLQREVVRYDEYTGRVEAVESVELRPRVGGYLQSVHFKAGTEVKKGQLLFVIDPRPFQAEYERLRAEEQRAVTRLELARSDLARAERLLEARAVSQEELDSRRAARREAEASLGAGRAAVSAAKLNLEFTRVSAPIDGRIGRALVTEGNLVSGPNAGAATLLTTIVSLDPAYVYFDADERALLEYIELDRSGERKSSRVTRTPVEVGLSTDEGFPHKGYMDFVDNRLDPNTGTIRGRAVVANPDRILTPGMFARVRLPGTGKYQATLVSDRAIASDQSNKFVLTVAEDGTVEYRRVKVGPVVEGMRAVLEGLKPGDRVITNGMQRVRPGMKAEAKEVPMPTNNGHGGADATPAGEKTGQGEAAPQDKSASKAKS